MVIRLKVQFWGARMFSCFRRSSF